jgi:DNA replication protein DnaC
LTSDTRKCPHCGAEISGEWVELPPALKEKYGRDGELWYPPCTPECEQKEDLRQWGHDVRRRKAESLLEKSEMPERLERCTLEAFDHTFSAAANRGVVAVERYFEEWEANREAGRGLYLCGGVGSGKTHLAAGLAQELIVKHHVPTLFHTAPELLDRLRPSEIGDRDEWASWAMNAELLVLDDLGAEKATEWARERLFVLVNHRYRRNLPTIYTSNIGPDRLAAHLGDRINSRIVETSEFVLVDGPDYRVETRRTR